MLSRIIYFDWFIKLKVVQYLLPLLFSSISRKTCPEKKKLKSVEQRASDRASALLILYTALFPASLSLTLCYVMPIRRTHAFSSYDPRSEEKRSRCSKPGTEGDTTHRRRRERERRHLIKINTTATKKSSGASSQKL